MDYLPCFSFVQSDDRLPAQAAFRQFGDERFMMGIASCDLFWGDISPEISRRMLETLFCYLESDNGKVDGAFISHAARLAFDKACSLFDPPALNSSITGQYIAAYCYKGCLHVSWIGQMFLVVWHNGQRMLENRPHFSSASDASFTRIERFFRRTIMVNDHTFPENIGPNKVEHPSILYVGDYDLVKAFPPPDGEAALRRVFEARDVREFQQSCLEANKYAAKLWPDSDGQAGLRSIFVYI